MDDLLKTNSAYASVLTPLLKKNKDVILYNIDQLLLKSPTKADGPGYVYGFHKGNITHIKIGYTQRSQPVIRIKEWNGTEIFSYHVSFARKFERLIHLFFKFANKIHHNPSTGKNEIEWFHFEKNVDVPTVVSMLGYLFHTIYPKEVVQVHPKININTASYNELITLPNIGPIIANRIIDDRSTKGLFNNVSDLLTIKGIGHTRFANIRDRVTV